MQIMGVSLWQSPDSIELWFLGVGFDSEPIQNWLVNEWIDKGSIIFSHLLWYTVCQTITGALNVLKYNMKHIWKLR